MVEYVWSSMKCWRKKKMTLKEICIDKIATNIYFKKRDVRILEELPEELKNQILEKLKEKLHGMYIYSFKF